MKFKSKLGILVIGCAITGAALLGFSQKEPYSTEAIVDSLWDQYSVQSTQYGDESSVMSITVYEEEDIDKVENYLEDKLSEEDLENYKLNVYQWSSNPKELKENAQENLEKESYSTEAVVDSLWDKYSIQSTQYGDESSVMSITVYEKEDIDKVEKYLEEKLSEEDLEDYKLNVYQWSSDVEEFHDNAQENLNDDDLNQDE